MARSKKSAIQNSEEDPNNYLNEKNEFKKIIADKNVFIDQIYEASPLPIFIFDVKNENEFIYVGSNKIHQEVVKFPITSFKGKSLEEMHNYLSPKDIKSIKKNYLKCVKSKKLIGYIESIQFGNSITHWHTYLNPILNKKGKVIRIIGNSHSVNDLIATQEELKLHKENLEKQIRKRTSQLNKANKSLKQEIAKREVTAEQLVNSQEFINSVLNAIPQKIFWKDKNHFFIGCNKSFADEFGLKNPEEIIGLTECDLYDSVTAEVNTKNEEKVIQTKKPLLNLRESHKDKHGNSRWFVRNILPFKCGKKSLGIIGTINEITAITKIEQAIEESEQRYSLAIEASNHGIWDWWIQKNEVYYSPKWKEQIGYLDHELENKFYVWEEHLHPDDFGKTKESLRQYLENPEGNFIVTFRFRHKNGSYRWIRNRAAIKLDNYNKPYRMFGAHSDITELKEIEEKLKEANYAKDKFFSIIAHDLRSPLTALLGFSEILKTEYTSLEQSEIDECLTGLNDGVKGLYNLILNLLEWARIQTNKIEFNPTHFNIYDSILEILLSQSINIRQKKIEIIKSLSEECLVYADEYMIKAVLRNLISNSVKFSNINGCIKINTKVKNSKLVISIKDDGIGIKKEDQDKIFLFDKHISNIGTNGESGTGLGLILCKEFVIKNNGDIWFESVEDVGSTFYFSIPLTENNAE